MKESMKASKNVSKIEKEVEERDEKKKGVQGRREGKGEKQKNMA